MVIPSTQLSGKIIDDKNKTRIVTEKNSRKKHKDSFIWPYDIKCGLCGSTSQLRVNATTAKKLEKTPTKTTHQKFTIYVD